MQVDSGFEHRQPKLRPLRIGPGEARLHLQPSEARVDRVLAACSRCAGDCHVGVADSLDFLQRMAGYDFVERAEVLVK